MKATKSQRQQIRYFESARSLGDKIHQIREEYRNLWYAPSLLNRQIGVALYFIDEFALWAGNETSANQARPTYGCCSLLREHVRPLGSNRLHLEFIGNFSNTYDRIVPVHERVYYVLTEYLLVGKEPDDKVFSDLTPKMLNDYLDKWGVSSIEFRRFSASMMFEGLLNELTLERSTEKEKITAFRRAALAVGEHLNHMKRSNDGSYQYHWRNALKYCIDPRITINWCKKHRIPYNKCYTKKMLEKFEWAVRYFNSRAVGEFVFYETHQPSDEGGGNDSNEGEGNDSNEGEGNDSNEGEGNDSNEAEGNDSNADEETDEETDEEEDEETDFDQFEEIFSEEENESDQRRYDREDFESYAEYLEEHNMYPFHNTMPH